MKYRDVTSYEEVFGWPVALSVPRREEAGILSDLLISLWYSMTTPLKPSVYLFYSFLLNYDYFGQYNGVAMK